MLLGVCVWVCIYVMQATSSINPTKKESTKYTFVIRKCQRHLPHSNGAIFQQKSVFQFFIHFSLLIVSHGEKAAKMFVRFKFRLKVCYRFCIEHTLIDLSNVQKHMNQYTNELCPLSLSVCHRFNLIGKGKRREKHRTKIIVLFYRHVGLGVFGTLKYQRTLLLLFDPKILTR